MKITLKLERNPPDRWLGLLSESDLFDDFREILVLNVCANELYEDGWMF